jgi:hypothetical protein
MLLLSKGDKKSLLLLSYVISYDTFICWASKLNVSASTKFSGRQIIIKYLFRPKYPSGSFVCVVHNWLTPVPHVAALMSALVWSCVQLISNQQVLTVVPTLLLPPDIPFTCHWLRTLYIKSTSAPLFSRLPTHLLWWQRRQVSLQLRYTSTRQVGSTFYIHRRENKISRESYTVL